MREIRFRAWNGINIELPVYDLSKQYGSSSKKPYILMQYTGIKDKNGKEIWEGDIVRVIDEWGGDTKHEVKYCSDTGYPAFDLRPYLDVESNGLSYVVEGDGEIEVIGNIYSNPELLEDES